MLEALVKMRDKYVGMRWNAQKQKQDIAHINAILEDLDGLIQWATPNESKESFEKRQAQAKGTMPDWAFEVMKKNNLCAYHQIHSDNVDELISRLNETCLNQKTMNILTRTLYKAKNKRRIGDLQQKFADALQKHGKQATKDLVLPAIEICLLSVLEEDNPAGAALTAEAAVKELEALLK